MDFTYITNNEKIYDFLKENTQREVRLEEIPLIADKWSDLIKDDPESRFVMVMYESKSISNENRAFLAREKALVRYYSNATDLYDAEMDQYFVISSVEDYIESLKKQLPIIESNLKDADDSPFKIGYRLRCGNCGCVMGCDDKYCYFCGTPRGEGPFNIYPSGGVDILYGCPDLTKTTCPNCGKFWYRHTYSRDEDTYCTLCGSRGEIVKRRRCEIYEFPECETIDELDAWLDEKENKDSDA